ncbi:GntR family transcriptional regulator [Cohnella sp. CIP 111063]|uniref:GntR family transcriptional regulator n=1 Tax=unclassified Cohnella TaxID=2636738 RepID=UPI000B8C2551|nr:MULTISPECIES: GntR family transcriptional regulator [unclassified Cohnella]OXS61710.1 GntR family transcriptional regulator [Cohnella sp. CIP 111063]PRX74140.1 GntR family transcriptional regulator [Cohnella sp. SGD-V74]
MNVQSPKYIQLKEEILSWIASGRYRPGDKLPSENELAEQFALSRQTVRQSLGELVQEGWLAREQGKGTFVGRQSPERRASSGNRTVGIITTSISDYIFPSIVRGVESALKDKGYRLLLSSTDHRKDRERECLEMMLSHSVCALIVEPTKSAEGNPNFDNYMAIEDHGIPMLMINERYPDLECPGVRVDDDAGGYMAADYLLGLGHRNIAGFFKTDDMQGVRRMKGFIRACRDRNLAPDASTIVRYSTEDKGERPQRMLREMLLSEQRPTGIVCYNDQLAVSLLDTIRELGLRIPEDLSMIGYDDSFLATATEIKLTTIEHPKSELGERAANLLVSVLENGEQPPAKDVLYAPKLIVRQSAAEKR